MELDHGNEMTTGTISNSATSGTPNEHSTNAPVPPTSFSPALKKSIANLQSVAHNGKVSLAAAKEKLGSLKGFEKDVLIAEIRKSQLKYQAQVESTSNEFQKRKVNAKWIQIMRLAKLRELKDEVEYSVPQFERTCDKKDAIVHMIDRDLDEAEEQRLAAVRSHLMSTDKLLRRYNERVETLHQHFEESLTELRNNFKTEQSKIVGDHKLMKQELQTICQQVETEEKTHEQEETTEHTTQYELTRNKNIEQDHQMKSRLEEQIEHIRDKCNNALQTYRANTDSNAQEYRKLLQQDTVLSAKVEQRLRQVERMQTSITRWKNKLHQNKQECEARNAQLRSEKEQLQKYFQELKSRMKRFRDDEKKRLTELSKNARNCEQKLLAQQKIAEKILRLAELCRKYETQREKVTPHYLSHDISVDEVQWEDGMEDLRDEIKESLGDEGIDEWTYLDKFFKRYNKVLLDKLAIAKEHERLNNENYQLRSILRQFLDGVSVNEEVMNGPNPLLVVNGKINLNHIPIKKTNQGKVYIEAATHIPNIAAQSRKR